VSTVPTMHGESVVMRILDKGGVALDFQKLGFADDTLKGFIDVLMQPHGILLVTGPTGSGKTTTLASMINIINEMRDDAHIITIEDPIEYYHKHKKGVITRFIRAAISARSASPPPLTSLVAQPS